MQIAISLGLGQSRPLNAMPSGAIGLWYADQYAATPRPHVPNALSVVPVSSLSLLGPGRRMFANSKLWLGTNTTLADLAATAPDGSSDASTSIGLGAWTIGPLAGPTLPAGTYTLAMSVKRNTGSDQTFALKFATAGVSATKTATSGWTRETLTGSVGAGAQVIQISNVASADANIQICDVELFAGSADLHAANSGHMVMGRALGDTTKQPTYAAGKLDFSGGPFAITSFDARAQKTPMTAIAVVEKVAAGALYQAFFSDLRDGQWSQFSTFMEYDVNARLAIAGVDFVPSSATIGKGLWEFTNRGTHVITQRYDGTKGDTFLDDIRMFTRTAAATGPTIADLYNFLLNDTSFFTGHKMVALALYDRALSDAEVRAAYLALMARAASQGITINGDTTNRIAVFEGDSITEGPSPLRAWSHRYGDNANPLVFGGVYAVSSSTIATMNARAAALDGVIPINKSGRKFILSILITNDLTTRSAAQYIADLQAYCLARYAAGWDRIAVATITPRNDGTFNGKRATVNASIPTWVGTYCNAVIDFAGDATIGPDAAAADTNKYSDGIHPTAATQTTMETIARPVLNAL